MRRIVFIVLAVVVAALVTLFCWREFMVTGINFVTDYITSMSENHLKVQRLYAAEVDFDAFNQELENIMNTTEYTEEEILAAAIASGKPEFFPSFNLGLYRAEGEIRLDGFVDIELAEGQLEQRFRMASISLEVLVTQGDLVIDRVDIVRAAGSPYESIVKVNSEQQAAADISHAEAFRVAMNGETGSLTLRFVYSIADGTFLQRTALTEQLFEVHAVISPGLGTNLEVEFITEPYSSLEEINNG
jgi:hypothetical protein